jgi:pimeloyl-ACP methyl ester carboxylesterase
MFKPFIPPAANRIQDKDAIALLQRLQRQPITVPQLTPAFPTVDVQTAMVPPKSRSESASGKPLPPLLLIHGFDSSLLEFRRLLPVLEPELQTWAMDLLGFGFTAQVPQVPVNPFTIRQHLYHTWKTVIRAPMVLVGASLGGAVALDFALEFPDAVERLVLLDSVGFSGSFPLGRFLFSPLEDWATEWLHFRNQTADRVLSALPFVDQSQQDLVRCASLHQAMPGWKDNVISFTKSGGYSKLKACIGNVQQPTLILWGTQDQTLGTEDATKFQRAIASSRLVWIQQARHAPHLDQPQAVAQAIQTFVAES